MHWTDFFETLNIVLIFYLTLSNEKGVSVYQQLFPNFFNSLTMKHFILRSFSKHIETVLHTNWSEKSSFFIFHHHSYSSTCITNMTPSTSALHIGSEQKLRDLYPNIRVTVTSPRKIFFKRVNYDNNKIKLVSLIHLII